MTAVKSTEVLTAKVPGITYQPPDTYVDHPAAVVYSQDFEANSTGWTVSGGSSSRYTANASTPAHTGTRGFLIYYDLAPTVVTASYTATGLTVGRSYTLSAWAGIESYTGTSVYDFTVGVVGKGTSTPVSPTFTAALSTQLSYTFTATATSHVLTLAATVSDYLNALFDDVTLTRNAWTETVTPPTLPDLPLQVISGDITLDSERAPYCTANVTVALPAEEYLEQLDPLDGLRLALTAEQEWGLPSAPRANPHIRSLPPARQRRGRGWSP